MRTTASLLAFTLLSLPLFTTSIHSARAEAPSETQLTDTTTTLTRQLTQPTAALKVELTQDDNTITLSHHTREWLVYRSNMSGDWSEQPSKEIGPIADGFIITASILTSESAAQEQWAGRARGLVLDPVFDRGTTIVVGPILHYPYWSTYGCSADSPNRKLVAWVNVTYNTRPDRELLTKSFTLIRDNLRAMGFTIDPHH